MTREASDGRKTDLFGIRVVGEESTDVTAAAEMLIRTPRRKDGNDDKTPESRRGIKGRGPG